MTDKKLTDAEIVKALECCVLYKQLCPKATCPMANDSQCMPNLRKYALDLINRLQAENDNLSHNNRQMTRDIMGLHKALETAKAENERLENQVICIGNECDAYKDILETSVTEAKAEAYKEFAERLKENASRGFWETDDYVGTEQIDDLLKELTEKSN